MKRATVRLDEDADNNVEAIREKLKCTRQEAIIAAIDFLAEAIAARKGAKIEVPHAGLFEIAYKEEWV